MDNKKESWSWDDFKYRFIETGWFDYGRAKTLVAMQKLWERVPQEDLDNLPADLIVFAPATYILGEVFPLSLGGESEEETRGALVYLSPQLERKSQAEVDSTVAHEFAHLVLGSHRSDYTRNTYPQGAEFKTQGDVPSEQDADRLISDWGYKPAYNSNRKKLR
jgi:hypothetical protein